MAISSLQVTNSLGGVFYVAILDAKGIQGLKYVQRFTNEPCIIMEDELNWWLARGHHKQWASYKINHTIPRICETCTFRNECAIVQLNRATSCSEWEPDLIPEGIDWDNANEYYYG
jgi:hypothetical protein